jgi:3-oxoacyl-[acyl-carrier protein] reductase
VNNVIVTGGSRGLGLGIAQKLAACGYRVVAIARGETEQLKSAMAQSERERPGSFHFVSFDLSEIEQIPELVRRLRGRFGKIYGLVNNAAIAAEGVLALMPETEIERLLRVNVLAPIVLTKYIVRGMSADGGGRIVNMGSVAGLTGYSGLSVYGATKSSLMGFTRSLAREVGRMGVTVNAVAAGFVETEMTQGLNERQREQITRRSALRRPVCCEDIAEAVEFLLSDRSKNITGTVLTVDAGNTA